MKRSELGIDEMLIIIRKNDFFHLLSEEDEEMLDVIHHFIRAEKEEYIYFDAHHYNKLFFIKEGFIKIGTVDDDGNELVRHILKPGDVFGQVLLNKDNLHGEFAQAYKKEVSLCAFNVESFEKILFNKPELILRFFKKIGEKSRRVENQICNLLHKDVRTRLLHFFWMQIEPFRTQNVNRLTLDNYLTHLDIARLTATSRQTVTTLINQFAQEGILDFTRKSIVVYDVDALQRLAKIG